MTRCAEQVFLNYDPKGNADYLMQAFSHTHTHTHYKPKTLHPKP